MQYQFENLVDINMLKKMMEEFSNLTNIPHGLLSPEGKILSGTGWQDICTKFHRVHLESNARCEESDRSIKNRINLSKEYSSYTCENGLLEYFTPIMIEGHHVATIILGQLLHEKPDIEFFRNQGIELGFDVDAYLEALDRVPIISIEQVQMAMQYFARLAGMLSYAGLNQLKQKEAEDALRKANDKLECLVAERTAQLNEINQQLREKNKELKRDIEKRKQIEQDLIKSEMKFRNLFNNAKDYIYLREISRDGTIGQFIEVNNATCERLGYTREEFLSLTPLNIDLQIKDNPEKLPDFVENHEEISDTVESTFITKYGDIIPVEITRHVFDLDEKKVILLIARDLTERKDMYEKLYESEQYYRALFDYNTDAVASIDLEGNINSVNKACIDLTGYSAEELINYPFRKVQFYEDIDTVSKCLNEVIKGIPQSFDAAFKNKEGNRVEAHFNFFPIFLDGSIVGAYGIAKDMTEKKKVERDLQESEYKYRALFDNSIDGIFVQELLEDGTTSSFLDVNNTACNRYGYTKEEFLLMKPYDLDINIQENKIKTTNVIEGLAKNVNVFETTHITKKGNRIPVEINNHIFNLKNKKIILTFVRDITVAKKAKEKLVALSELHKKIIINIPIGLFAYDTNGRLTMISENYYKIAEVENVNIEEKIDKINVFENKTNFNDIKLLKNIIDNGVEYYISEKKVNLLNGKEKYLSFKGVPLYEKNRVIGGLVIVEDITERRKALEEIHLAKDRFSKIFYSSPNMMMVSTLKEGRIIYINNNFTNALGYTADEMINKTSAEMNFWVENNQREKIVQLLLEKSSLSNFECKFRTKFDEIKTGLMSAELIENDGEICILGTFIDITERKRTERLTILGELATSIAHEIKNPLAIIKGYAELIDCNEIHNQEDIESINQIIKTVDRLDRVVNSVLSFAKLTEMNFETTNINNLVSEVVNLVQIIANKKGILVKSILNSLPDSFVDVGQIYQCFFNILINGIESMENGGELQVNTWYNPVSQTVNVAFVDQGVGISKNNLSRIFNPFFSTKKLGTGLGLAIVSKIIKEHGGNIDVSSQEGLGSTFIIRLPQLSN